jgi:hypothetical protein
MENVDLPVKKQVELRNHKRVLKQSLDYSIKNLKKLKSYLFGSEGVMESGRVTSVAGADKLWEQSTVLAQCASHLSTFNALVNSYLKEDPGDDGDKLRARAKNLSETTDDQAVSAIRLREVLRDYECRADHCGDRLVIKLTMKEALDVLGVR